MSTSVVTITSETPKWSDLPGARSQPTAAQDPAGASVIDVESRPPTRKLGPRLIETVRHFWHLGVTAFGGPGVHVVILRRLFVEKLEWLDATTFADLFTLGNALPGPGSTQLAFSIAIVRNGTLAGLLAFLLWSIPGALGMGALGFGVKAFPEKLPPLVLALLTGLNASAVGLIALAAWQLSQTAITDPMTRLIVLASASFGICYHAPWMYPVLVFGGGTATLMFDYRKRIVTTVVPPKLRNKLRPARIQEDPPQDIELESLPSTDQTQRIPTPPNQPASNQQGLRQRNTAAGSQATSTGLAQQDQDLPEPVRVTHLMVPNKKLAFSLGIGFAVFIIALLVTRNEVPNPPRSLDFFSNMVLAGVIIFGGGPVVIPLLRGYTVENGWVESRDFLLGFAILQAFPGPNFNFAVYLGVLALPSNPVLGGFLGWLGIFSPGIMLKLALLPAYNRWRKFNVAKSVLRGLNAAAAGLVFTAVWQLFLVGYIYTPANGSATGSTSASGPLTSDPFWGVVAASAFVATQWFKSPPAVSIAAGALAGMAWFGVVGVPGTTRGYFGSKAFSSCQET